MTRLIIPEPDTGTDHIPEEYAAAANRVSQTREQVLGDAAARATHDALKARIDARVAAARIV